MTEGPYEIVWASSARRGLNALPEKIAAACVEFVCGALAENPHRVGRELRLELEGRRAARRGEFRVIYRVDEAGRVATITAVEHRRDVYRPR